MDIPFEACMNMVENGAFDPTKLDRQQRAEAGTSAAASAEPTPVPVVASAPTIVEDSSRLPRTLQ